MFCFVRHGVADDAEMGSKFYRGIVILALTGEELPNGGVTEFELNEE